MILTGCLAGCFFLLSRLGDLDPELDEEDLLLDRDLERDLEPDFERAICRREQNNLNHEQNIVHAQKQQSHVL